MTKVQYIKQLKSIVKDGAITLNKADVRFLFHDYKDMLHKEGVITDSQVQNWILTDRELKSILKVASAITS